jgi:hypothetical protein
MFARPERNKEIQNMSESLLELIDDEELNSVENEIIADVHAQEILRKRSLNEFRSQSEKEFRDEKLDLSNWFTTQIRKIVRFKIFTFHTINDPDVLQMLTLAKAKLVKQYGKRVFQESEDSEVESEELGN